MHLLSSLNDRQQEAVLATEGPVLIVAGAGTGKTMALTYRIAYLIEHQKVHPRNILAVTFTNKAAGEMKERVEELLARSGTAFRGLPMMGTFHSICVQILRREIHHLGYEPSFTIYDADDSLAVINRVMKELQISEKNFIPKAIRGAISAAKNVLQTPKDFARLASNIFEHKAGQVYEAYQKALQQAGALDFDDLLMKTVQLFQKFPDILTAYQDRWKYLHVDEYQDTNFAQWKMVSLLAQAHRNLCVVGDPDQSIYSWRGADMTNILEFTKEYPDAKVVKLEQNYRSTPHILKAAESVITFNKNRIEKTLWTVKTEGEKLHLVDVDDEKKEAEYVMQRLASQRGRLRDHVVLYRVNAQSRLLEEACLQHGIPYKVIGGVKFYARKEIKDMVAYLRLIYNSKDDASLLRVINVPARQIGAKTVEALQSKAALAGGSMSNAIDMVNRESTVRPGALNALQSFSTLISELREFSRKYSASTLIREVLKRTKYDKMLLEEHDIGQARLENVEELVSVAKKYDSLELGIGLATFLEEVALVSDTDDLTGTEDYLTLMTVHSAKGLEFKSVYVVGLEEGIFPHSRSFFEPEQMEEERRLMYVAMTRAKEHLHLIFARRRLLFGETQYNPPSSFLSAVPLDTVDEEYLAQMGEEEMVERLREMDRFGPGAGAGGSGNAEPVVFSDETPPSIPADFSEGDLIEHNIFGRGVIRKISGNVAEVEFERVQHGKPLKKLVLGVAPMRKV